MAGIGFALRKTLERRTFTAYVRAYMASLAYASGPWICTIVALGGIVAFASSSLPETVVEQFTVTTVYIYAFSLLLSGGIQVLTTRYVSDQLYRKNEEEISPAIVTALLLTMTLSLLLGTICARLASLPPALELSGIFLFCLVNGLWVIMSYITCLKDYSLVTGAFFFGMVLATSLALLLSFYGPYPLLGLVWGYSAGHLFVFAVLVHRSFKELHGDWQFSFGYLSYFRRYPLLLLIGFLTNLAIWIDKFVIWFHHGSAVWGIFFFYPLYDIPAYLAYLTAIPSTAFFLIKVETNFARQFEDFIDALLNHPSVVIREKKLSMIESVYSGLGQLLSLQGVITLICMMTAQEILDFLWLDECSTTLFRFFLLAAYCHFAFLHIIILLMYFDKRREIFLLLSFFVICSAGSSHLLASYGDIHYFSLGYLLAAALSAAIAARMLFAKLEQSDADILFRQPLINARGEVIRLRECTDGIHGGRVLLASSTNPAKK